jgi:hypothetical protein
MDPIEARIEVPAGPNNPGPVVNVVTPPDTDSVMTSVEVWGCEKDKITAASAELAIASDARPATANRISEERMDLILPV